jgi:hypothetical protein
MLNLLIHNQLVHELRSAYGKIIYSTLYNVKSIQFSLIAWSRSWTILYTFDPKEWKKRIIIISAVCLALIVSFAVIMTSV